MNVLKKDQLVQDLINSYGNWVQEDNENEAGSTARMTKEMYPYETLFSPIRVNNITLKNRIVMGPMGNVNM